MIIKDIQHITTGQHRTDGRYPQRIGSTVRFLFPPEIGQCLFLDYETDRFGNPKEGCLRTSTVIDITESDNEIVVETLNSRYILTKV